MGKFKGPSIFLRLLALTLVVALLPRVAQPGEDLRFPLQPRGEGKKKARGASEELLFLAIQRKSEAVGEEHANPGIRNGRRDDHAS